MNNTKAAIHDAFLKLYRSKPYEKISVKELCATAHVARTTFYSYYDNLNDSYKKSNVRSLITFFKLREICPAMI